MFDDVYFRYQDAQPHERDLVDGATLTLEPGDLVSTGTPAGVGYGRTPQEFLKPGDLLETEIEGIGVLRNRIGGQDT